MRFRTDLALFTLCSLGLLVASSSTFSCATSTPFDDDDDDSIPYANGGQGGQGNESAAGGEQQGTGGVPVSYPCGMNCSEIETDQCHVGECNLETLKCSIVNATDGISCDDELFCTTNDACVEGACTGGPENDCDMTPGECEKIVCAESSESCHAEDLPDNSVCTSSDLCEVNTVCTSGTCSGTPMNCTLVPAPDECHVMECNPANGNCEAIAGNEGDQCSDPSELCTVGKTCSAGVCQGGQAKDCSYLTQGCVLGVCETLTGDCTTEVVNPGDLCDDLDPCTTGETCNIGGICSGGAVTTTCVDNDNCCPAQCDETTDNDCILQVLLVGDDVDSVGWDAFRTALTAAGETWTEVDLDQGGTFPDAATLQQYNTLVWFDESTLVPGNTEAQVVADWLALGGRNLFVAGVDFLWDFENGATGSGEHNLYLMWGTTYMGDGAGTAVLTLDANPGDPLMGEFAPPNGLQLNQTYDSNGDYADATTGPATQALIYTGGTGSGLGYSGFSYYNAGTYKTVWLGVNFHNGLANPTQQNLLMAKIINFFKS